MIASFRVLDLSVESEVIVEFDSEVFYFGFSRDDAVEHDNLAGRSVKPSGEQNRTTLFCINVDSPQAKPCFKAFYRRFGAAASRFRGITSA
jgi:hypothetical protein